MGVRFISVTDSIDSMKQAYDMLLPIKNIFNEQYARDISKKIQATVKSKQKQESLSEHLQAMVIRNLLRIRINW